MQTEKHPQIFLGNGALIRVNKVLTTRELVKPYANDSIIENLFAFAPKANPIKMVNKVTRIHSKDGIDVAIVIVSNFHQNNNNKIHLNFSNSQNQFCSSWIQIQT